MRPPRARARARILPHAAAPRRGLASTCRSQSLKPPPARPPPAPPTPFPDNTITGSRALTVDGAEVLGSAGSFTFFSAPLDISFAVDAHAGRVMLVSEGGNVLYRCIVTPPGGTAADVPEDNAGGGGGGGGVGVGADAHKLRVAVEAFEDGVAGERGEPVVFYRVRAVREADERGTVVHRRFRDFFALNDAVRAAYKGSQLLGSFPEPPPRGLPFFDNQNAPAFRERRRWLLADYLRADRGQAARGRGARGPGARGRGAGLTHGPRVRGLRAAAEAVTNTPPRPHSPRPPCRQARVDPAHAAQRGLPVLCWRR